MSSTVFADASYDPSVLGSYRNVSVSQSAQKISHAIDQATDDMGFMVRNFARKRLKSVNPPSKIIRISHNNGDITTDFDGRRYVAQANGKPRRNVTPEGSRVEVSYRWDGRVMHARYKVEQGEMLYDFTPDPERRKLNVRVRVHSRHLTEPVSYTLAFVRAQ